ncbi:MMPL family transporter [Streptomyces sp. MJM8645]|uniref:MMPL family transporter n=1 Tax=Streptomyces sp. MJM8645 TaxID=1120523 RepID=UPI00099FE38B|nr:MMPL family transporter [Streptomyces sp. MJM8645]
MSAHEVTLPTQPAPTQPVPTQPAPAPPQAPGPLSRPPLLYRLGVFSARRRGLVCGVWLLAVAASIGLLPHFLYSLRAPVVRVDGSESVRADRLAARGFPLLGSEQLLLVFHSEQLDATDPRYADTVAWTAAALRHQHGVRAVAVLPTAEQAAASPPADDVGALMAALSRLRHDPHNAYALVGLGGDESRRQERIGAQQAQVGRVAQHFSDGAVSAALVGRTPVNDDLRSVELADLRDVEGVAVILALVVLLLGLGTVGAALVPVALAGAAIALTFGLIAAVGLIDPTLRPDTLLVTVVTVVGLGIGIDYALFVVVRFQEEIAAGAPPEQAAGRALATSGRTVCYSGAVVAAAATSMLLLPSRVFRDLTAGTCTVTAVVLAATLTLLPAGLAGAVSWLGRGALPGRRPARQDVGDAEGQPWARWARRLMRRPVPYLLVGLALLGAAAAPALGLSLGVDFGRHALAGTPSGAALAVLESDALAGAAGQVTVLVPHTATGPAPQLPALLDALRAQPQAAVVQTVDNGRDLTMVVVVPAVAPDSPAGVELVRRIRELTGPLRQSGTPVAVGGFGALLLDITREVSATVWWVIGSVLALSLCYLVFAFRSLLLPLKAVAMNLLATGASYGLTVAVFQHGWAQGLLGFTSTGRVQAYLPVIVFAVLFGLSMDHEVFLVRRIREEYLATGDNTRAVALGLQRTARPITTAALVMVLLFAGLLADRALEIKEIGFALAVAVALDATVVRLLLVPTVMRLLGEWNWWLPAPPIRFRTRASRRDDGVSKQGL